MFRNIKSFFQRFGSIYESSSTAFPQLDVDKLKVKLNLKQAAYDRGSKNLPASNTMNTDDVELKINQFIDDEVLDASEKYISYNRAYEERLNQLKVEGHIGLFDQIAGVAESDFDIIVFESRNDVYTARDFVKVNEVYLENFKVLNKLNRPAYYPETNLLSLSIILLLMVFETIFNAYFFSKADELGWLGGITTALGPTIINFSLAYFLGDIALRYSLHVNRVKRTFGYILSILLPLAIVTMNLGIAHLRDSMQINIENPAIFALNTFWSKPFVLVDIKSWLFMSIGCIFSLLATRKFWKLDDPYPHYGEINRKRDHKINYYNQILLNGTIGLETKRNIYLEKLVNAYRQISSRYTQAASIIISKKQWNNLFINFIDHIDNVGRVLIAFYRQENVSSRSSKPPKLFNTEWRLDRSNISVLTANSDDLEAYKYNPQLVESKYSESIDRIKIAFERNIKKFQTIEELSSDNNNV